MDPSCGVPPCPNSAFPFVFFAILSSYYLPTDKVWDYSNDGCMDCDGTGRLLAPRQLRKRAQTIESATHYNRSLKSFPMHDRRRGLYRNSTSTPTHTLQKRIKECLPFHFPRPTPSLMPNIALAWLDDNGNGGSAAEGPTAAQIAARPEVQAAFQVSNDLSTMLVDLKLSLVK
jgi:hypothetical protein